MLQTLEARNQRAEAAAKLAEERRGAAVAENRRLATEVGQLQQEASHWRAQCLEAMASAASTQQVEALLAVLT